MAIHRHWFALIAINCNFHDHCLLGPNCLMILRARSKSVIDKCTSMGAQTGPMFEKPICWKVLKSSYRLSFIFELSTESWRRAQQTDLDRFPVRVCFHARGSFFVNSWFQMKTVIPRDKMEATTKPNGGISRLMAHGQEEGARLGSLGFQSRPRAPFFATNPWAMNNGPWAMSHESPTITDWLMNWFVINSLSK